MSSWQGDPGVVVGVTVWGLVLVYCAIVAFKHDKSDISDVTLEMDTSQPPPWRPNTDIDASVFQVPAFTIVIALLQSTLRRAYDGDANTAFFLLHSLVNAAITALVWPELCTTLGAPIYSLRRPYSLVPSFIQIAMHLAHIIVDFRTLTLVDWMHHLLSSILVGVLNIYYTYGPLLNYAMCFATGLPGGIDYLLLFCVKRGHMTSLTEKRINRGLNMVVRCPGLTSWFAFSHLLYAGGFWARDWRSSMPASVGTDGNPAATAVHAEWNGENEMPFPFLAVQWLLIAGNGIFFADRVVANCAEKLLLQKQEKAAVAKKGT